MDTCQQATVISRDKASAVVVVVQRRQRWSITEKRRIVEATLVPGASVARVALFKLIRLLDQTVRTSAKSRERFIRCVCTSASAQRQKMVVGSCLRRLGWIKISLLEPA